MTTKAFMMAALLTVTATTSISAQSYATDKGSIQLSGSASWVSTKEDDEDDRGTTIVVQPSLRYFITPGLAVGTSVMLGHTSQGDIRSTSYGIGPSVAYYFGGAATKVHPFVSAGLDWSKSSFDPPGGAPDNDITFTSPHVSAGLLLLLSSSVGVETELFYRRQTVAVDEGDTKLNMFGLQVGIAAFIF